jgi:hypothetical protein
MCADRRARRESGLAAAAIVTAALPMLWRYDARTYVPTGEPGAEPQPAALS